MELSEGHRGVPHACPREAAGDDAVLQRLVPPTHLPQVLLAEATALCLSPCVPCACCRAMQGNLLVPPCIARNEAGQTQVRIDIEDRAHRPALVRISADSVRIHITINVAQEGANEVRLWRSTGWSVAASLQCWRSSNMQCRAPQAPAKAHSLQSIAWEFPFGRCYST